MKFVAAKAYARMKPTFRLLTSPAFWNGALISLSILAEFSKISMALSMSMNALAGNGFILTGLIGQLKDYRKQSKSYNTQYTPISESITRMGSSLLEAQSDPEIGSLVSGKLSDMIYEMEPIIPDTKSMITSYQAMEVEAGQKEKAARAMLNDPVLMGLLGLTGQDILVFGLSQDWQNIRSILNDIVKHIEAYDKRMSVDYRFVTYWNKLLRTGCLATGKCFNNPLEYISAGIYHMMLVVVEKSNTKYWQLRNIPDSLGREVTRVVHSIWRELIAFKT